MYIVSSSFELLLACYSIWTECKVKITSQIVKRHNASGITSACPFCISSLKQKLQFGINNCKEVAQTQTKGHFIQFLRQTRVWISSSFFLEYQWDHNHIHPEGTWSNVACHDTGVLAEVLTVLLSAASALTSSSTHFKVWCWSFCNVGLHSTMCMCNDSVKFLNFDAPYTT